DGIALRESVEPADLIPRLSIVERVVRDEVRSRDPSSKTKEDAGRTTQAERRHQARFCILHAFLRDDTDASTAFKETPDLVDGIRSGSPNDASSPSRTSELASRSLAFTSPRSVLPQVALFACRRSHARKVDGPNERAISVDAFVNVPLRSSATNGSRPTSPRAGSQKP